MRYIGAKREVLSEDHLSRRRKPHVPLPPKVDRNFFPGPVQAIDRMKKDIVAMRGVVSAVKKSIGEAQALL